MIKIIPEDKSPVRLKKLLLGYNHEIVSIKDTRFCPNGEYKQVILNFNHIGNNEEFYIVRLPNKNTRQLRFTDLEAIRFD